MQTPQKVKLVIDMPKCCGECPVGHYYDWGDGWCDLVDYHSDKNNIKEYSQTGKPFWCPLNNCEVMEV